VIDSQLSHYRITAKLGAGGMGDVYRAEDTKLGRAVALKVLPEGMAAQPDRLARFAREAKAVASLNHPNIVTLHSIEEADTAAGSVHFLTMELVAGKTIGDLLPPTGFSLERIVELALPITDAIASAHAKGVVHRDLKPANVMVSDEGERVKVLDFGLAKLSAGDTDLATTQMATLTETGAVMGTPFYMSPEQARGADVDQRSDIFSFGVMLFEMVTGTRPFRGANVVALLSALLTDVPPVVTEIRPELPPHLGLIVQKCLEKSPADRYQTAREVHDELRALKGDASSTSIEAPLRPADDRKAIAVLPFANMSDDADNEFFSDGMTEDLLAHLSTVKGLRVISRTSVMIYKGTTKSIREVAKELSVQSVLEGSVRRAGNKVRIVAKLIEASSDSNLWTGTYDRELDDIFAVQSDVAENIAAALKTELAPDVVKRMRQRPTEEMDAYDLFLRGRQDIWTLDAVRIGEGFTLLEKAIELDPKFAAAHALIALGRVLSCYWGGGIGKEELPRGRESAERALELDQSCALAWVARGSIRYHHDWDWKGAEQDLKKALALDPNEAQAHFFLSVLCFICERFDEGLAAAEAGLQLDPHSAFQYTQVAYCQWLLGRDEEAERGLRTGIERHPSDFNLPNVLGVLLRRAGRFQEAAQQFALASRMTGEHPFLKASHALCLRLAGDREGAKRLVAELDTNPEDPRLNHDAKMMLAVARTGDARGWLADLEGALDRRSVMAPWFLRALWESVGDPPRNYAPGDFEGLPRNRPEVLAVIRRLWPGSGRAVIGTQSVRGLPRA
jgi:serine/threonine protein kinase/Flp pilus assembly protein TadD